MKALEEVDHLGLLLDVLDLLDDVEVGGAGAADVDGNGSDERVAGKLADLGGHGRREEQGLALMLCEVNGGTRSGRQVMHAP